MVYFVLMAALNVLGIIAIPFFIEETEFLDVIYQVVNVIGLIGLYGFIKNIPIGSPRIWATILAAEMIMFVGYDLYQVLGMTEIEDDVNYLEDWKLYALATLVLAVFLTPYWYALYRYSFKSKEVWGNKV